ncbi:MAG: YggS family pyridoxal phosphate-dependent enzyme [Lachnospiraceae bacterium]
MSNNHTACQVNYEEVEKNICIACRKVGRKREEITLLAVSKTKPISLIKELYEIGVREFGENKVQELSEKIEALPTDIQWHMIGHLQRNKVKYLMGKTTLIHSVDSLRLAQELQSQAEKHNLRVSILIEVNMAEEDTKFGIRSKDTEAFVRELSSFQNIQIQGLMTSAPNVEDPEENRVVFRKIKQLAVDISKKNIDNVNMNVLSMGMSNDYMVAIEEGSTMVRVGTGIFGKRNYNI